MEDVKIPPQLTVFGIKHHIRKLDNNNSNDTAQKFISAYLCLPFLSEKICIFVLCLICIFICIFHI